jgi:MFS transporter, DHA3 family, multidrug efflux protein
MKTFYHVLSNSLLTTVTNFFVWFALTFWMYLTTGSVLTTAYVGGAFMIISSFSSFWFGSIVDHNKKKNVMLWSTLINLLFFVVAFVFYITTPVEVFKDITNPAIWIFSVILLVGVIASNIRTVTLPTLVTMLVPEDRRDKANGMSGIVMGISSFGAGLTSGVTLAYAGMFWVLIAGMVLIALSCIHLALLSIPEKEIVHVEGVSGKLDIKGTVAHIKGVPGLFALIFFTTFNNFLGGVFMALMDAYGLTLMPVQAWSILWSFLSLGFIFGGIYISKKGLGKTPLRFLFTVNIINWTACFFFTIQPSIILLAVGTLIWTSLAPFIEATEQTIIQKVVPLERQGRVFGFAQSFETAAMPISAFIVGSLANFIFIPFMTTGAGVDLIGSWFGTGPGRGIALVFMATSLVGLVVTLIAMRSRSYKLLAKRYQEAPAVSPVQQS